RFPDPEDRSRNEELCVAPGEAGEEGGEAPDRDADADHRLANATVGPNAKWNRRDRIDQQEGAPQQTNLAVGQVELGLDLGDGGRPSGFTREYATWRGRWQRWRRLLGRTSETAETLKVRRRALEAWR